MVNLDDPCSCGIMDDDDVCNNLEVSWASEPLEETEPGLQDQIIYILHLLSKGSLKWIAHMEPPLFGGYRAFYVRLSFSAGDWSVGKTGVMDFTTTVSVVPNNFPHPDCNGDECLGTLL